ncbi:glycine hydroxymethyltransferase [Puccinia striiformis f. sp. tritici PST-78]|uniref:Serine hydroxymethyltransferase n=1 Tax=Puccinia striiformis f. sp. tritici PST-78 TaxID=1165861 RepID=A0A0L0VFN7_9BASI|nr:glycine hydroxymethyltransferase [Puccinia striiformis f. sp. tritici PST-78]
MASTLRSIGGSAIRRSLLSSTRPSSSSSLSLLISNSSRTTPSTPARFQRMTLSTQPYNQCLYTPLAEYDPEVQTIIEDETYRQFSGLELIASENLTSLAVMEANGSILTNKYSEGLPGARYYGGNEHIDKLEILCQQRALKAFRLDPQVWGVNVQPYSGSTANFATFTALIDPQDRIMGLGLPDGGHLTHGFYTAKRKISASSIYFQSFPYNINPDSKLIDYEYLEKTAKVFKPKILICGASAYPRDWDYHRLRKIADDQGAFLMMDMAHISGLVAGQVQNNPFEQCDIVTTTTHKTLRGPRAGLIFFRKDKDSTIESRINNAVFPACQGGPHNNTIAAIAVALKQAADPSFQEYAQAVIENSQALAARLVELGYDLQTGGSDNHLVLWDLRPIGLTGSKVEKICDLCHITINKNAVSGDTSAQVPGGVRLGTSALTSRSMGPKEMIEVADFMHRVVQIALKLQAEAGTKQLKDFLVKATEGAGEGKVLLDQLHHDVAVFSRRFGLPGVDVDTIKVPAGQA